MIDFEELIDLNNSEDGYNSSDFEFISEEEASKAGIITKFNKNTKDENIDSSSVNDKIPRTSRISENKTGILNSRKNEASSSDYIKYSKYRYQRCYSRSNTSDENHTIPVGEQYLDMFRGANAPVVMNDLYTMRNKSVMPPVLMAVNSVNHEDLMFLVSADSDIRLYYKLQAFEKRHPDKDEVKESVNEILATYPHQNRRKRRRH